MREPIRATVRQRCVNGLNIVGIGKTYNSLCEGLLSLDISPNETAMSHYSTTHHKKAPDPLLGPAPVQQMHSSVCDLFIVVFLQLSL